MHKVITPLRLRLFRLFIPASWAVACAGPDARDVALAQQHSAVIYGTDDRHDVYAESDADIAALAMSTAVALIRPTQLRFSDSSVVVRAAPLSEWDDYCADTSFLDQPTAATCSGVLIDDDLVLTAGHCLEAVPSCRDYAYVFNYAYASKGALGPIQRADLFSCRAVAVAESSPPDSATQVDFAIVALDRPVVGRSPAELASSTLLRRGDSLTVIGFPSGLPVKIDSGARVVDPRAESGDFFRLVSDTFAGNSGSGIYSANAVVGVFAHGTADFVDEGACRTERVITQTSASGESATYVSRAIDALCAKGWPSERLCSNAPSCGDGVCSVGGPAAETNGSCPDDCAAPICGDDFCEQIEWDDCPPDCGDRRPTGTPDGWYCEPVWYGDGETCDCNCGAIDSDCGSRSESRSCESVGPAGLDPKPGLPQSLTIRGGCSLTGAAIPTTQGFLGAIAIFGALARRRKRYRQRLFHGEPLATSTGPSGARTYSGTPSFPSRVTRSSSSCSTVSPIPPGYRSRLACPCFLRGGCSCWRQARFGVRVRPRCLEAHPP